MHSRRHVLRSLGAVGVALLLGMLSTPAFAAAPNVRGTPRVTNPRFGGVANTMMYNVAVTVSGAANDSQHDAQVGFINADDYTTCNGTTGWKYSRTQRFDTTTSRTWTLYNFVPGESYMYRVQVGSPSGTKKTKCGVLTTAAAPTPTLPTDLGYLNLQYAKSGAAYDTDYVLFETDDCGPPSSSVAYLVAVDAREESIVWYLETAAMTDGGNSTGFRYQAGADPVDDRILMMIDNRYLYEFRFDGTQVNLRDFAPGGECDGDTGSEGPCVHHDAFTSDRTGRTYVLATQRSSTDAMGTAWEDHCGADSRFLNDGFQVLDSAWSVTSERYVMTDYDYDPTVDGGPHDVEMAARPAACDSSFWAENFDASEGSIDWIHANSITAIRSGSSELLDVSLKAWDQVVRVDSTTGALLWRLSADTSDSDWGTLGKAAGIAGAANFSDQHDVHATATNTIMLFDNVGEPTGSRVLEIGLTTGPTAATINKSWAIVDAAGDPLECPLEGSGQVVPGSTHVLAMCVNEHSFGELSDATGNLGSPPPLYVYLPDGTSEDYCTSGGPSSVDRINGWQKAFPMANVGEF